MGVGTGSGRQRAPLVQFSTMVKPSIEVSAIKELRDQGLGATEIAKRLCIGRASVYRVLGRRALTPLTALTGSVPGRTIV